MNKSVWNEFIDKNIPQSKENSLAKTAVKMAIKTILNKIEESKLSQLGDTIQELKKYT